MTHLDKNACFGRKKSIKNKPTEEKNLLDGLAC